MCRDTAEMRATGTDRGGLRQSDERLAGAAAPLRGLYVRTYGCQMNVYDSERMGALLAPLGYRAAAAPEDADMVLLNTCHIREKASEKVYSELGRLRRLRDAKAARGERMILAVAGCVAQAEGAEMVRRAPFVDIVVGPQSYHRLPEMVARAHRAAGRPLRDTSFPAVSKFDSLPEPGAPRGPAAFLTVQEGCDKFCAFCVVPYTRGAEASRPAPAVEAEARALVAGGAREIALLGQNVNAWRSGGMGLADLLFRLAAIDGLERLRYTTSHPTDMSDALVRAHGDLPQLMPALHLPVQSGSDRVLAAMNRRHTRDDYRRIVDALRAARPDIALSSDFIVGHPGESERDFADTLDLAAEVGFAGAYAFAYSPRPGTPAAAADDPVPEDAKRERLAALQALLSRQRKAFNRRTVGREAPVLFERPGRHPGQWVGRSPWMQAVHVDDDRIAAGDLVDVRIVAAAENSLAGEVARAPD